MNFSSAFFLPFKNFNSKDLKNEIQLFQDFFTVCLDNYPYKKIYTFFFSLANKKFNPNKSSPDHHELQCIQ